MVDETEKQFDIRIDGAKREHDRAHNDRRLALSQVQTFSVEALKAPTLVAAGGIAAALGFYSANYDRLKVNPEHLATFNSILMWLFGALLFIMVAPAGAYFTQLGYLESYAAEKHDYQHPFVHQTPRSRRFKFAGDALRFVTVLVWIAAVTCLMRGGWLFLRIVAG